MVVKLNWIDPIKTSKWNINSASSFWDDGAATEPSESNENHES